MSRSALVSVIIPTFNMAKFLPDAVRSVLSQTHTNLEIHVVDDGSTDDTAIVMKQFEMDNRVFLHKQPNGGVSNARNRGIQSARGDFIGLCDADDLWTPNKLELQLTAFQDRPELGIVYCTTRPFNENGAVIKTHAVPRFSGKITSQLLLDNFVTGSTSLIRKECFDKVGLYDESLTTCEDYDLWLRISLFYEMLFIDEPVYEYRQWEGQASSSLDELKFYRDAITVKEKFLTQNPYIVDSKTRREIWAAMYSGRAKCVMRCTARRMSALPDIIHAIQYCPWRLETWKAALKVLVNRVY